MRIRRGRLRELRGQRGMTQAQVAEMLGCSRSAVSMWETTGRPPRPSRLKRLADLFGVSVREIVDYGILPTLRDLRVAAGMRQADIARRLHVQTSTYCDVETGRQNIPARWVPVLSVELRVSTHFLTSLRVSRSAIKLGSRAAGKASERRPEIGAQGNS
ncbi:helix-turn-helix transcriptional regulator [Kitasatospora aureofaciens]|uniref:helix-turn-helix transcriptional regulator n=1 Tax=Kitasatospora aureofaciens TaxID=1894 RepID=UPI0033B29F32